MSLQTDADGNERRFIHRFVDFRDKRVLEIGCGEGRLTWKYAAKTSLTIGFDSDLTALRIAQVDRAEDLAARVFFLGTSAEYLPFAKEKFDIAVLSWSL